MQAPFSFRVRRAGRSPQRCRVSGFTLVELLVVVGIIAVLIAILLPTLAKARRDANRAFCLSNIRGMEIAQMNYVVDNHGYFIQAGLGHGSEADDIEVAWFTSLQKYYQSKLAIRCPSDASPYWPDGVAVPNSSPPKFRRTSYTINDFVAGESYCPWGPGMTVPCPPANLYTKINRIPRASVTVQFCELAYLGEFAGSDHCHLENWVSNAPNSASKNLETSAHGGHPHKADAISNFGFLDGHAETLPFSQVFTDFTKNRFDPSVAQ